jgi:hypothetical protein
MDSVSRTRLIGFGLDTSTPEPRTQPRLHFFHHDYFGEVAGSHAAQKSGDTPTTPRAAPGSELRALHPRSSRRP